MAQQHVCAQNTGSPYTSIGIGTLADRTTVYSANMGGLGLSNGNPWILNTINPALLPLNNFTTFDAAFFAEARVISSDTLSQRNIGGNLRYLVFGFPLEAGKLTISAGLMPYSFVDYDIESESSVLDRERPAKYFYKGDGGYNQVYVAGGLKISEILLVGLRVGYLFGEISDESLIAIAPDSTNAPTDFLVSAYIEQTRMSGFIFQPGLVTTFKLGDNTRLNVGATYEFGVNANTFRDETLQSRFDLDRVALTDTLFINQKFSSKIPPRIGLGVSITRPFMWTVGLDVYNQNWNQFRNYKGENEGLANAFDVIAGAEFIPDFNSVSNYLKRVTYQIGFQYKKTPLMVNNRQIDDFGINFGVSLPVGGASLLNVGFTLGQMGASSDGLIKEEYARIRLGMTFNDRSFAWYRSQRKFN
jgi:hypothetical protein